jgi:DNA polymerase
MNNLMETIKDCKLCELYQNMPCGNRPVPGMGPQQANIMIVGESLSKDDSILEEPISGLPGQLLEKILNSAGLSRENCYITMSVKCFCDSKPKKKNILTCGSWIVKEIAAVKPKVIFSLGKIATSLFIQMKSTDNIGDFVGQEFKSSTFKIVPLYSMSYLLQHSSADVDNTVEVIRRYSNG